MALPKLNVPVYEAILPSTETVIKYRPLLVKEKKILSTAMESEDVNTICDAYKQIINNSLFLAYSFIIFYTYVTNKKNTRTPYEKLKIQLQMNLLIMLVMLV